MSLHDDIGLTLRIVSHGRASNWPAYAALLGMLAMIGGMVAMMWFLSSQPTSDLRGWLCGALSVAGLGIWRRLLPEAVARDSRR
jgi:hypothetical protein